MRVQGPSVFVLGCKRLGFIGFRVKGLGFREKGILVNPTPTVRTF